MSDSAEKSTAWVITPDQYLNDHPPRFESGFQLSSCYVPVRDRTKLAVDIYLPKGGKEGEVFPTLVIFTPYYRRFRLKTTKGTNVEPSPTTFQYRDFFIPHGYAMVLVDIRGTGASFGCRDGFRSPTERQDYYDIAEWIVHQPWCSGQIGSIGISYSGAASCFLASTGHPAVKAVIPTFATWDTYSDQCYLGGMLLNSFASFYSKLANTLDFDLRAELKNFAYFGDPQFDGPAPVDEDKDGKMLAQAISGHRNNVDMNDFIREFRFKDSSLSYHPDYTLETFSPHFYAEHINPETAYYCVGGWMDSGYGNACVKRFRSLRNRKKHLLIGPWEHGARTNVSPFREAVVPQFKILAECLRFFDHYLKGISTGLNREKPVHYFTIAEEAWKASDRWPVQTADTIFYFGPLRTLTREAPSDPEAMDEYRADFGCGTGSHTRYERLVAKAVEEYYKDWHGRDAQMLIYTTPILDREIEITGHPIMTLYVSSTERDGAFFTYLEDVEPDGTCRHVTEGMLRAIHRKVSQPPWNLQEVGPYHSFRQEDAQWLIPGEPKEISFALFPISWLFRRGHQIRVALAVADRDHFSLISAGRAPLLRFYHSRDRASKILLPIVKH